MKSLMIITLVLAAFFGSTFFIMASNEILTVESIETLLSRAQAFDKRLLFLLIVLLLFSDLFIAIPTMSVCILSGYFLGFPLGFVCTLVGTMLAGLAGYALSKQYGRSILKKIINDADKLNEMEQVFDTKGGVVILLCRAMPMLPEISSCLAGANNMRFGRFIILFLTATIPYTFLTTLAGSYSSLDNPKPAIYAAIGISLFLWLAWLMLFKGMRTTEHSGS
tara:strand:- start:1188 stop:1853 length:666 start_codon:yes stop_codon:yes gene_type:complete